MKECAGYLFIHKYVYLVAEVIIPEVEFLQVCEVSEDGVMNVYQSAITSTQHPQLGESRQGTCSQVCQSIAPVQLQSDQGRAAVQGSGLDVSERVGGQTQRLKPRQLVERADAHRRQPVAAQIQLDEAREHLPGESYPVAAAILTVGTDEQVVGEVEGGQMRQR